MAQLNTQAVADAGTAIAFAAATAGGDQAQTGEDKILLVRNGDAAAHTVTLVTPGNVDNLAIADRAVVVAAGAQAVIPLQDIYRDPVTNLAALTYDAVANVTVAVLQV